MQPHNNFAYGQMTPPFMVPLIFLPSPIPIASSTFLQEEKKPSKIVQKERIQIDLSAEELKEAGYKVKKRAWEEHEDAQLLRLSRKASLNWKQIAEKMPGRSSKMCYSRYRRLENQSKNQWRRSQDQQIIQLIGKYGFDWERISQHFELRSSKQIEDHYKNYLREDINKEPWTLDEDLLLIELLRTEGKNWSLIESRMNHRTQCQIKNRYFGRLKVLHERKVEKLQKKTKK